MYHVRMVSMRAKVVICTFVKKPQKNFRKGVTIMKKSMKKAILTGAAVAAVMAAMSATAMAATLGDDGVVTLDPATTLPTAVGSQATVLVLKPGTVDTAVTETDIVFIDQWTQVEGVAPVIKVDKTKLADGEYIIKLGGEGVNTIVSDKFTVGTEEPGDEYKLGDATGDSKVDSRDSLAILKHVVGTTEIVDATRLKAADCDKNTKIDSRDSLDILNYVVGKPSYVGGDK